MKEDHSDSIWGVMQRWKTVLLIITGGSVVAALVFSLPWMITPRFRSTVIMYPASTTSLSTSMLNDLLWSDEDLLEFGEREQADQLKQVLESDNIRERLITRYGLKEHYRIDPGSSYPNTRLKKEYERNVAIRINEYGAVELTVYDTDPQLAADMANKMAALLDSSIHTMQKVRALSAEQLTLRAYRNQTAYIHMLEDSLSFVMAQGVHDYESQAQSIYQELAIQLAWGNNNAIQALEDQLRRLGAYGGMYISIRDELELEKERLSLLKTRYEKASMDARQDLPQKFIVNDAYKSEKKAYPMQWAIVTGSGLSTFLFAFLILLGYERFDRISSLLRKAHSHIETGVDVIVGKL